MGIQRRMIPWRIEVFTCWRTVVCIPLCALALMIAACGVQAGGASGRTATSASGRATPMTAIVHTPTSASNPSSGTGQILLLPGSSHYATSDAITITIRNSTSKTVYAVAHFTDCSIIVIEQFVASNWRPMNLCANGYPHPVVTRISPGTETAIQMTPSSASSGAQAGATSQWPLGTYRAALTYTSSLSTAFSAGTTIISTTFLVG
jgi:hypothetical protein